MQMLVVAGSEVAGHVDGTDHARDGVSVTGVGRLPTAVTLVVPEPYC